MRIVARSFMLISGSVLNTQQHAKEQSVAEYYQGVLCEEYLEEEPCCKVKKRSDKFDYGIARRLCGSLETLLFRGGYIVLIIPSCMTRRRVPLQMLFIEPFNMLVCYNKSRVWSTPLLQGPTYDI